MIDHDDPLHGLLNEIESAGEYPVTLMNKDRLDALLVLGLLERRGKLDSLRLLCKLTDRGRALLEALRDKRRMDLLVKLCLPSTEHDSTGPWTSFNTPRFRGLETFADIRYGLAL